MKAKYIIFNFLIIVFVSCTYTTSKKERIVQLKYTIKGDTVFYETKYALIVFDKNDVIKNIKDYLKKNEQYDRQVFLDYLLQTNDIIILSPDTMFSTKLDTISQEDLQYLVLFNLAEENDSIIQIRDYNDICNYYVEPMFWCAYELIRKGKCEITSKIDFQKIKKIKVVYNRVPINTTYTEFFFENDTLFFKALTGLGL